MSMFPDYNFNNPDLNYTDVLNTVYEMYSYVENGFKCCGKNECDPNLTEVDGMLLALSPTADPADYKNTVKSCYQTLKPLT